MISKNELLERIDLKDEFMERRIKEQDERMGRIDGVLNDIKIAITETKDIKLNLLTQALGLEYIEETKEFKGFKKVKKTK